MQLLEVLIAEGSINIESQEWQRVIKQLHVQLSLDLDKLEFYKCYACKFTLKGNRNTVKIAERSGFFVSAKQGILILCPSTTDLPLTIFVDKKTIRVVEHDIKLLKAEVNVKTNDEVFCFKSGKKQVAEIEKEINKVRLG